jgi:hypothetical protein
MWERIFYFVTRLLNNQEIPVKLVNTSAFLLLAVVCMAVGCKKEPDPRTQPGFNAGTAKDPGTLKMGPEAPAPNAPTP